MRTTLVGATAFALAIAATPAAWAQGAAPADGTNVGALLAQAKTPDGKKALVCLHARAHRRRGEEVLAGSAPSTTSAWRRM